MGTDTKIQWTHHTFNPWIGCTKVHAGCTNCYAEAQNGRWGYNGGTWGKGAPRKVTGEANWKQPLKWARDAAKAGERRRVFCASLADVLDEEAPVEARERLWGLIRGTAQVCDFCGRTPPLNHDGCNGDAGLDWLLLTKRPERWQLIPEDVRPLVWLGTSISDQATADEWVPRLLKAEGFAVRFLSIEPQVGPIDLNACPTDDDLSPLDVGGIDWVIVGGESGHRPRIFDGSWARSIARQCERAGVPCFVKQMGALALDSDNYGFQPLVLKDRKGGDWSEWPEDLRVREFPETRP